MKDLVRERDFFGRPIGKNLADFVAKVFVFVVAPKIVDEQKAAILQIAAKGGNFLVVKY